MSLKRRRFPILLAGLFVWATVAALRDKYDLHMQVERYVSDDTMPETDQQFIRK